MKNCDGGRVHAVLRLESPQWWIRPPAPYHARWRSGIDDRSGIRPENLPHTVAPRALRMTGPEKASNREYLKAMELEDQDTGERIH